jgi:probable addiction module antidote protein
MATKSYDEFLQGELRDPEVAAEYLSASLEAGSVDQFLVALRSVAEAHGGIGTLSEITDLNRQSMYRMLSEQGNPTLASLRTILRALGIDIAFRPITGEAA